jgi:serine/threonine-protein kinase RsbW
MAEIPNVRLSLSNRPENVLVVRQALTGVAGSLGLDAIETNDLNTAVTEACNNVVLHAYEGDPGPMWFELKAGP